MQCYWIWGVKLKITQDVVWCCRSLSNKNTNDTRSVVLNIKQPTENSCKKEIFIKVKHSLRKGLRVLVTGLRSLLLAKQRCMSGTPELAAECEGAFV